MIESALLALLTANAGVAALAGTRIYAVQLPQQPTLPAVTYELVSDRRQGTFTGPAGLPGSLFRVHSWAAGYAAAKALANAVRAALDGYQGTVGGETIQAAILEGQTDIYEPEVAIWRTVGDYRLWWNES